MMAVVAYSIHQLFRISALNRCIAGEETEEWLVQAWVQSVVALEDEMVRQLNQAWWMKQGIVLWWMVRSCSGDDHSPGVQNAPDICGK